MLGKSVPELFCQLISAKQRILCHIIRSIIVFVVACVPLTSQAHFGHNYDRMVVHLVTEGEQIHLYARMPLGLTVVNARLRGHLNGLVFPFSSLVETETDANQYEEDQLRPSSAVPSSPMYRVDLQRIQQHQEQFTSMLIDSHWLSVNAQRGDLGKPLELALMDWAIHPVEEVIDVNELSKLQQSISDKRPSSEMTYVGDSVVDVYLRGDSDIPFDNIRYVDRFIDLLYTKYQVNITLYLHKYDEVRTYHFGTIASPALVVANDASLWYELKHFFIQGVQHILTGWDHLVLLGLLVLASTHLLTLIGLVTGFTIGHSLSLAAAVIGIIPNGSLLIPTIEWLIALTIVILAWHIWRQHRIANNFIYTACIGLIHGIGFSFLLTELLSEQSRLVSSLLAFNIGIETGQVLLIGLLFFVLKLLKMKYPRVSISLHRGLLLLFLSIGAFWSIERGLSLLPQIGLA